MFSLRFFGGALLEGPHGPIAGRAAQRHPIALLALLATAGRMGRTRDKLIGYLWPENSVERARHSLSDSVYRLNRAMSGEAILASGDILRLNIEVIESDVEKFAAAVEKADWEAAVRVYSGPFLDGFFLTNVAEFEEWSSAERTRFAAMYAKALESLARKRADEGNLAGAVTGWRQLAGHDPHNARVAMELMRALDAAGNRAGALQHARVYTSMLREEFGTDGDPDVTRFAEELRRASASEDRRSDTAQTAPGIAAAVGVVHAPEPQESVPLLPAPSLDQDEDAPRAPRNRWRRIAGMATAALLIFLAALGTLRSARDATSPLADIDIPTLAVLPFQNLSDRPENRYFSDGVTEDVLAHLSRIAGLRVIARSSVMPYRNREMSVTEIAHTLGATHVLRGSTRRFDDRVRITARLIDGRTGVQLWAKSYDRKLQDVFAVQSEIARTIAMSLETEITPEVSQGLARVPTEDLTAYDLFLRGRDYANRGTRKSNARAIDFFRRALGRQPGFALARALLAQAYVRDVWNYGAAQRWIDSAAAQARHALNLTADLAPGHAALAGVLMARGKFDAAAGAYERALALRPSNWRTVNNLGILYFLTGRTPQAIRLWQSAVEGDPANAFIYLGNVAEGYQQLGRLAEARRVARYAITLSPEASYPRTTLALVALLEGDTAAAVSGAEWLARASGSTARELLSAGMLYVLTGNPTLARQHLEGAYRLSESADNRKYYIAPLLGYVLRQAGDEERAARILSSFQQFAENEIEQGNEYYLLRYSLAQVAAARGEREEALRWLDLAVNQGWSEVELTLRDPLLESLKGEPRFRAIVDDALRRRRELAADAPPALSR